MKKLISIISVLLISILSVFLLGLSIKGDLGSPVAFQQGYDTKLGGPFESSGSNSRFALVKSIVENNSFYFSEDLAKFASPDVTAYNGQYTTLFTPGVSFAAVPFYYLGQQIGLPQLLTFASTGLFALINIFLIYAISRKFNVSKMFSWVAGLIFAFATPALAYSNTLTQHHLSVLFILSAILVSLGKTNVFKSLLLGVLIGAAALVDIPNLFMMAPIGLYVFFKHFSIISEGKTTKLKINAFSVAIIVGLIPLFMLFGWYNFKTVGSYTKLAQSVGRTDIFATDETKEINNQQRARDKDDNVPHLLPFLTRFQLNGFYILVISNERGIFYYSPILIFGVLGLTLAFKNKNNTDLAALISSVTLVNVVLYSMFGDPWGGWSFGPRYLIPAIAMLSTSTGIVLSRFARNPTVIALFIIALIYSVGVSVLGSVTTNLIPPKVEALNLAKTIPYTYEYNFQLAKSGQSSALIYNNYLRNLFNVETFVYFYSAIVLILIISLLSAGSIFSRKDQKWVI